MGADLACGVSRHDSARVAAGRDRLADRRRCHRGELLGVAPKSYVPTYREFYERRWFAPGDDQAGQDIRIGELQVLVTG
mgnify:CR=1 FL=1